MESNNRVAILAIIVEDVEAVETVNATLHEFAPYIVGRMGLPYREKNVNVISVVLDAPMDKINALTGRLGNLEHISAKAVLSKV